MKISQTHIVNEILNDFGQSYTRLVKVHILDPYSAVTVPKDGFPEGLEFIYIKEYETGKGIRMEKITQEKFVELSNNPL